MGGYYYPSTYLSMYHLLGGFMSLLQEMSLHGLADCEFNRKLLSKFEVQHFTLCDGWVNTWLSWDKDGNVIKEVFDTYDEAKASLDEFLDDELYEFNQGNIDSMYEIDEFRIMEIEGVIA